MAKIPAAAPTAAPLTSCEIFALTSAFASSISSRTRICARSETSWIAWAIFVLPPCSASWRARISSVLIAMSVASQPPEDERRHEPAGERRADQDLRAVRRDPERQLARLVGRRGRWGRSDGREWRRGAPGGGAPRSRGGRRGG